MAATLARNFALCAACHSVPATPAKNLICCETFRAFSPLEKPLVSVVLIVVSLGTRTAFAYMLSPIPALCVSGIWLAIPTGWFLADTAGVIFLLRGKGVDKSGNDFHLA